MKRNMDLIRTILLRVEELGDPGLEPETTDSLFKDYDPTEVNHHIKILEQDKYLFAYTRPLVTGSFKIKWIIEGMTMEGHEFVEASRDNERWEQAKKTVFSKVGSFVLDSILQVLLQLVRKQVGI